MLEIPLNNLSEKEVNLKTQFDWVNSISMSGKQEFKTPFFLLNADRNILCRLNLFFNFSTQSTLVCQLETKNYVLFDEVTVVIQTEKDFNNIVVNLNEENSKKKLYSSEIKLFLYINNSTSNKCRYCGNYDSSYNYTSQSTFATESVKIFYKINAEPIINSYKIFKSLFCNEEYSDLTITVDDVKFKVHKIIISNNSEMLKKAIDIDMIEKQTNNINLHDIDPVIFEEILKFLYIGFCDVSKSPHEIFKFAHQYEIFKLQLDCKNYLLDNLNINNFIDTLRLVKIENYGLDELKTATDNFMEKNESSLASESNFIKYLFDNLNSNNFHYLFRLIKQYSLDIYYKRILEYLKNNLTAILENKDFEDLLIRNPKWQNEIFKEIAKSFVKSS